jgi:hypothetical protein
MLTSRMPTDPVTTMNPLGLRAGRRSMRPSLLPARLSQAWQIDGHSRMWWESLVLARKAGVVLLAVLVTNAYLQTVGAVLWFFMFLMLQLKYQPYEKPMFNQLESLSLLSCFLTAAMSCALLQYNVGVASSQLHETSVMEPIEWATTTILLVMNLGTLFVLVGVWLRLQLYRAKAMVKRVASGLGRQNSGMVVLKRASTSADSPSAVSMTMMGSPNASITNPLQKFSTRKAFVADPQIPVEPVLGETQPATSDNAGKGDVLTPFSGATLELPSAASLKTKRDSRRDFKPHALDGRKRP